MTNLILILLPSGISFAIAWITQKSEIDALKEELKLEKAKVEFYKNRKEKIKK